jgi:REP element-mobilizing transposase RayT
MGRMGALRDEPTALFAGRTAAAGSPSFHNRALFRSRLQLLAAHVKTNHVHVLVEAEARPERVMNDLKSFASRRLNELGFDTADRRRWARHGSTRWLWKREDVLAAVTYVVDKQGEKMAVYQANL